MPRIFMAVPVVSPLHLCPHPQLIEWAQENALRPVLVDNFQPPWQARQEIVKRFLESNAEDLLMCDYDTVPRFPLQSFYYHWKPSRILAGHYALFTDQTMFQWSVGKHVEESVYQFAADIPEGLSAWDICGFGCTLMPRRVVQRLQELKCFSFAPIPPSTEEIVACRAARGIGIEIMTTPGLKASHFRTVDLTQQLEVQAELARGLESLAPKV